MESIRNFDCLKAYCYSEKVVKSDFFPEMTFLTSYVRNMIWVTILYKYYGADFDSFISPKNCGKPQEKGRLRLRGPIFYYLTDACAKKLFEALSRNGVIITKDTLTVTA